jgi:rare lipoprotein A
MRPAEKWGSGQSMTQRSVGRSAPHPDCARPLANARSGRRVVVRVALVAGTALVVANCSQQKFASNGRAVDPKYGVVASPRVVGENEAVPKGGGRELVGRPYVVAGRTYVPSDKPNYVREGLASWYGTAFHGRLTANGEIFDRYSIAAAHPTLPLPSYVRVTNAENRRSMIVRVNDRGPFHGNRIMDVSERVAEALNFRQTGTARVRVEYVGRASLAGSDDTKLLATLRTDGMPAAFPGQRAVMVADAGDVTPGPVQRQALAFRDTLPPRPEYPEEAAEAEEITPARRPAAAPVVVAAALGAPVVMEPRSSGVPLPPERPFDLGTIPNAATPVPGPVARAFPPSRPAYAGLFYAAPDAKGARFAKSDPFKDLAPQRFVSFRRPAQDTAAH